MTSCLTWSPSFSKAPARVAYLERRVSRPSCLTRHVRQASLGLHEGPSHRQRLRHQCQAATPTSTASAVAGRDTSKLAATLLGYAVLTGSMVRSVPQIIRIVTNKSVEGLSLTSFVSELVAYTIITAYNFNLGYPFSSYGEVAACWIQDIILVFLVLYFRKSLNLTSTFWTAIFVAFTVVVMGNLCGSQILYGLQASTIAMIALGARVPQIVMNFKRGNSGELSLLTCLMNVMGCFTRMFTTWVLTKDSLNMIGALVQAVLNGILLYQTIATASQRSKSMQVEASA